MKTMTQNLAVKLVDSNVFLNDSITLELDLFLSHLINDHQITEHNLDRLIDGYSNKTIYHKDNKQPCEYSSLIVLEAKCLLSKNWGKQKDWNINNSNIRKDVYKYFSSNLLHFINRLNVNNVPLLPEVNSDINSDSIVLVNKKAVLKTLVSSKTLTDDEVSEFSKTYDLIIHGISRILTPEEFTDKLIQLALLGVTEISIPDNKESKTRLFRDFDKEATGNLMLLTGLIDVKIGGSLIKSEPQVLNYCTIASQTTSASQMADIRKIQAEWIEQQLKENKNLNKTMGHFKGSFNKVMTRAIVVERCRNNKEVLDFFKNNLQDKIALVDDKVLAECINTSISRGYKRLIEKYNTQIEVLNKFYVFDKETLLNEFKALMRSVEVSIIDCRVEDCQDQIINGFELCLTHLKEAQDEY